MYGLILDSIEANVENAQTHVEGANIQLSKASLYQVKSNISLEILFFFIKNIHFIKVCLRQVRWSVYTKGLVSATTHRKSLHEGTSRRDLSHEQFTQSVLRKSHRDLPQNIKPVWIRGTSR